MRTQVRRITKTIILLQFAEFHVLSVIVFINWS